MTHRDGSSRSSCRRRTLLLRQASLLTLHACMGGQGMQAYHTIPYHTIRTLIDTFQTYICMYTVRCATAALVALSSLCLVCPHD